LEWQLNNQLVDLRRERIRSDQDPEWEDGVGMNAAMNAVSKKESLPLTPHLEM